MISSHRGFIALISAVIISAVILVIGVTGGLTGFFGRSNILDSEFKNTSAAIAEACADQALLQLANSITSYDVVGATLAVSGNPCTIGKMQNNIPTAGQRTFETTATYKNFTTSYKIAIQSSDVSVVSWQEIPTY
jgi:hypothetical protein